MEHFKKRIIHQHQTPLISKSSPKTSRENADDDASSNSSGSSGGNAVRKENKKEGNMQSKIARKKSVCRSKFRHNSLKIFKLGTSIPTSLCKTKEPYNVCAEKTLQRCETRKNNNGIKQNELVQKEAITEQIINTIEGSSKTEKLQRSVSGNQDYSTKMFGKHNLPAIISEIPIKRRRHSSSRNSEGEQNSQTTNPGEEQTKPNTCESINCRRKTVTGTENFEDQQSPSKSPSHDRPEAKDNKEISSQTQPKIKETIQRISPDSTFAERDIIGQKASTFIHPYPSPRNTHFCPPVNIELQHKISIPFVPTIKASTDLHHYESITNHYDAYDAKKTTHSPALSPIETALIQKHQASENPINLSVKHRKVTETQEAPHLDQHKPKYLPSPLPELNPIDLHRIPFPGIQQQLLRLQNNPPVSPYMEQLIAQKTIEEKIARSAIQMARTVMDAPFSVDNLISLSEYYKILSNMTKNSHQDIARNIKSILNKIIIYVTLQLFEKESSLFKNYAQRIMEANLQCNKDVLNDVVHLVSKKCYEREWMEHFLMILSRNERKLTSNHKNGMRDNKRSVITNNPHQNYKNDQELFNNYPPWMQMYYPQRDKPRIHKTAKPREPDKKPQYHNNKLQSVRYPLYPSDSFRSGNYPADSRYIPPKTPMNAKERTSITLPPEDVTKALGHQQNYDKQFDDNPVARNRFRIDPVLIKEDKITKKKNICVTDAVIVKDESMEVTKGHTTIKNGNGTDKNVVIVEKMSKPEMDMKKNIGDKNGTKNSSVEDLHLFKELLKKEDKNIYDKILNKIFHVKESVREVITIDDEEDQSTKKNRTKRPSPAKSNNSSNTAEVVIIDDDTSSGNKLTETRKSDCNQNYMPFKVSLAESHLKTRLSSDITKVSGKYNSIESKTVIKRSIHEKNKPKPLLIENVSEDDYLLYTEPLVHRKFNNPQPNFELTETNQNRSMQTREGNFQVSNRDNYKLVVEPTPEPKRYANYPIQSPPICIPNGTMNPFFGNGGYPSLNCRTPESTSPIILHSPGNSVSPLTPHSGSSLHFPRTEGNANWRSWIFEERKKGLLDAKQPIPRRPSVETISSVGSDYSPNVDLDDNYVKIKIDAKCYRVKKTVMECIPKGKLCYVREKNYLIRYFDDNQLSQFIKNMNISLVSPAASDFLKQIKDRLDVYSSDDIFITPYEVPEKNEVIQLDHDISFTKDDYISIPELYVEEVEKVEKYVPKDFLGFYKYVTGYQIVNNHHPISFQTFLTMHNTNGIKIFYKKYLLSILENKFL